MRTDTGEIIARYLANKQASLPHFATQTVSGIAHDLKMSTSDVVAGLEQLVQREILDETSKNTRPRITDKEVVRRAVGTIHDFSEEIDEVQHLADLPPTSEARRALVHDWSRVGRARLQTAAGALGHTLEPLAEPAVQGDPPETSRPERPPRREGKPTHPGTAMADDKDHGQKSNGKSATSAKTVPPRSNQGDWPAPESPTPIETWKSARV